MTEFERVYKQDDAGNWGWFTEVAAGGSGEFPPAGWEVNAENGLEITMDPGNGLVLEDAGARAFVSAGVFDNGDGTMRGQVNVSDIDTDTDAVVGNFYADGLGVVIVELEDAALTTFEVKTSGGVQSVFRVLGSGAVILRGSAAPDDSYLAAGDVALWFDGTNGSPALMLKGKQNDGTVVTGTIALA